MYVYSNQFYNIINRTFAYTFARISTLYISVVECVCVLHLAIPPQPPSLPDTHPVTPRNITH